MVKFAILVMFIAGFIMPKNDISAQDQQISGSLKIKEVSLSQPGYVVVRDARKGVPGGIMGRSGLLAEGRYRNLTIELSHMPGTVSFKEMILGDELMIMLLRESDGIAGLSDSDLPIYDFWGRSVYQKIELR